MTKMTGTTNKHKSTAKAQLKSHIAQATPKSHGKPLAPPAPKWGARSK